MSTDLGYSDCLGGCRIFKTEDICCEVVSDDAQCHLSEFTEIGCVDHHLKVNKTLSNFSGLIDNSGKEIGGI